MTEQVMPSFGLVVQEGDTLIIGLSGNPTREQTATMREQIEAELPGVRVLVVANVAGLAAYQPPLTMAADLDTWFIDTSTMGDDASMGGAGRISAAHDG